jgi:hypothetical protein
MSPARFLRLTLALLTRFTHSLFPASRLAVFLAALKRFLSTAMPLEFTNPAYVPAPADGSAATFSLLDVPDAAARLALPQPSAVGRAIRQMDDLSVWSLVPGGTASDPSDWICILNPSAFVSTPADAMECGAVIPVDTVMASVSLGDLTLTATAEGESLYTAEILRPDAEAYTAAAALTVTDLVITPAGLQNLAITGVTTAGVNSDLHYTFSGIHAWSSSSLSANGTPKPNQTAVWLDDGTWWVKRWNASSVEIYAASKASEATSPVGLADWTVDTGEGEPSIAASGSTYAQLVVPVAATLDPVTGLFPFTASGSADAATAQAQAALDGYVIGSPVAEFKGQVLFLDDDTAYICRRLAPLKYLPLILADPPA